MTKQAEKIEKIDYMWRCTNQRCGHAFMSRDFYHESSVTHPDCPKCRTWTKCMNDFQPGAPNVLSARTRGSDQALRGLSERYGLSDMGQRGGTRIGETAQQIQQRALATGDAVCNSTKAHQLGGKVTVPAGGPRFGGAKKAIPTQVVASHKG